MTAVKPLLSVLVGVLLFLPSSEQASDREAAGGLVFDL
jgi:hypothetical protein